MKYMNVPADKYHAMKKSHEEMMADMPKGMKGMMDMPEMRPVDDKGGYVAFDTSQEDKEGKHNLECAHEANLERFGLNEQGAG